MATPVDPQTPEASGQKDGQERFLEVTPRDGDQGFGKGSAQDPHQSVWAVSLSASKWRSAPRRGVRAQLFTDDPEYRRVLREQEIQLRSTVPLPLGAAMDKETLRILLDVEKTYRRHLGPDHALTADAQRRIQMLRDRTSAQSVREEPKTSRWRRSAGRHAQTQNNA